MNYSKERLIDIFAGGGEMIKSFQLPSWDELPKIELYMDQVIALLSE